MSRWLTVSTASEIQCTLHNSTKKGLVIKVSNKIIQNYASMYVTVPIDKIIASSIYINIVPHKALISVLISKSLAELATEGS